MHRPPLLHLLAVLSLLVTACSGNDDDNSTSGVLAPEQITHVVFSPIAKLYPQPNDLMFAGTADGTFVVNDTGTNPVTTAVNALDGNSVISPIDIAFSGSLDASQTLDGQSFIALNGAIIPNPAQNIYLLPLSYPGGDSLIQASVDGTGVEVPTFADAIRYQSAVATSDIAVLGELATPAIRIELLSMDGGTNNVIRILPLKPLQPKTKYLIVVGAIDDAQGNAVMPSIAYDFMRDPESDFSDFGASAASLEGVRGAINGWIQLANGYHGFAQSVFQAAGLSNLTSDTPEFTLTLTFTTGGTTDILTYNAAPELFFENSQIITEKQAAISRLVSGIYNLSGDNTALATDPLGAAINSTLNVLLTSAAVPGTNSPNPLFNPEMAAAINAGAGYADLASSPTSAYLMQRAAAEAAIAVNNNGGAITTAASSTVQSMLDGVAAQLGLPAIPPSAVFPVAAARANSFYRVDDAADITPLLRAPAKVYQGQISLPHYQVTPTIENNGAEILSARWQADATIGSLIDIGVGNAPGSTPPSENITYRYPFPTKQGDVTVPVLAVTPNETVLNSLGFTKPAQGWPVVIYVHAITSERSNALPLADAMAFACVATDASGTPVGSSGNDCYATVAIDQPLHGISAHGSEVPGLSPVSIPGSPPSANIGDNSPSTLLTERHFNFTASEADGVTPVPMNFDAGTGESGSLYINLSDMQTGRDNLRQMVLDLLNLNASLGSMDVDGDGTPDFDTNRVYLVGHSLGAIASIPFISVNNHPRVQASQFSDLPIIKAAVVVNAGGALPTLLTNSPSFSLTILSSLAQASTSLSQGRSGLESYLAAFQATLNSIDALVFASSLSDKNASTGILLTEVIGDGGMYPRDQVIPNGADTLWGSSLGPLQQTASTGFVIDGFNAPLAGTEPLIQEFGAVSTTEIPAQSDGDAEVVVSRFTVGTHETVVSGDNPAAFLEILKQTLALFDQDGIVSTDMINDSSVLAD